MTDDSSFRSTSSSGPHSGSVSTAQMLDAYLSTETFPNPNDASNSPLISMTSPPTFVSERISDHSTHDIQLNSGYKSKTWECFDRGNSIENRRGDDLKSCLSEPPSTNAPRDDLSHFHVMTKRNTFKNSSDKCYARASSQNRSRSSSPTFFKHSRQNKRGWKRYRSRCSLHHDDENSRSSGDLNCYRRFPRLPAKRMEKFSDLPLEWWEREEDCKLAKEFHTKKIDYLWTSREDLVLQTTLYKNDTVMEKNMFPCKLLFFLN